MKLLLWNILLSCIVIAKASEVLGSHEDPKSDEGSSLLELMKKSRTTTSRQPRSFISSTIAGLMMIKYGIEPSYMKDNSSWMTSVIVPIIHDFVNDDVASENVTRLFRISIETVLPLVTEILNASSYLSNDTYIKIPRAIFDSTYEELRSKSVPLMEAILDKKSGYLRFLLANNPGLVVKSIYGTKSRNISLFATLFNKIKKLYRQYADLYLSSTEEFVYTRPADDIVSDINSLFLLLNDYSDIKENWSNNLLVLQNASGITYEAIEEILLDMPGMYDVREAMSFAFLFQMAMLFT